MAFAIRVRTWQQHFYHDSLLEGILCACHLPDGGYLPIPNTIVVVRLFRLPLWQCSFDESNEELATDDTNQLHRNEFRLERCNIFQVVDGASGEASPANFARSVQP